MSAEESKQQHDNLEYIVRKLGFDGIYHCGGFYGSEKDQEMHGEEYHMTVYNWGADI